MSSKLDKRGQFAAGAFFSGQHGPETGVRQRRVQFFARHHDGIGNAVTGILRVEIPHDRKLFQMPGKVRHLVRELDSRQSGVNHIKFAAHFGFSGGLGVGAVVVAGSTSRPDQNAVRIAGRGSVVRLGAQQRIQGKSESPQRTNLQQKAPSGRFTVRHSLGKEIQHDVYLSQTRRMIKGSATLRQLIGSGKTKLDRILLFGKPDLREPAAGFR